MRTLTLVLGLLVFLPTAFSLEITEGVYKCDYQYQEKDGEGESRQDVDVEVKTEENNIRVFSEGEEGKFFVDFLSLPTSPELQKEIPVNYHEVIIIDKFKETQKKIKATYKLTNIANYTESLVKVKLKKKKNGFRLIIVSKDLTGYLFDSSTVYNCQL